MQFIGGDLGEISERCRDISGDISRTSRRHLAEISKGIALRSASLAPIFASLIDTTMGLLEFDFTPGIGQPVADDDELALCYEARLDRLPLSNIGGNGVREPSVVIVDRAAAAIDERAP